MYKNIGGGCHKSLVAGDGGVGVHDTEKYENGKNMQMCRQ